jgi:hypothetical protein
MFPSGNIVRQTSKFDENVPVWELFAARMDVGTIKFPDGNIDAGGEAPQPPLPAPAVDRQSADRIGLPPRAPKRKELFPSHSVLL